MVRGAISVLVRLYRFSTGLMLLLLACSACTSCVLFVCACVCLFVVISLSARMHALLHIPTEHFHYWGFLVSLCQCEKPIGYNLHLAG